MMIFELSSHHDVDTSVTEEFVAGRRRIREIYRDIACRVCKKIDKAELFERGFAKELRLRSRSDLFATPDFFTICRAPFIDEFQEHGIQGAEFLPVPRNDGYFIVHPSHFVETDPELTCFEYHNLCDACGRYRDKLVGPLPWSLKTDGLENWFFASTEKTEACKIAFHCQFLGPAAAHALTKTRLKGVSVIKRVESWSPNLRLQLAADDNAT